MLCQSFLFGAVYQSYLYYLPLYFQNVRQFSVIVSAAYTAVLVTFQSTFSILGGQYISRKKRYGEIIWAGFGSWTLGSGLMLYFTRTTHPGLLVIPLVFVGIGVGFIFQPTLIAFQAHVPKSKRAVITSNRNFFRCAGGACGLAISAAVLQAVLRANLPADYAYLAEDTYSLTKFDGPAWDEVLDAYMAASRAVFILQVPLIGICLVGCLFVRDRGLQPPEEEPVREKGGGNETSSSENALETASQNQQAIIAAEDGMAEAEAESKTTSPVLEKSA